MMASTLGVDMVMTGHSLGRNKLEHLLASGKPSAPKEKNPSMYFCRAATEHLTDTCVGFHSFLQV